MRKVVYRTTNMFKSYEYIATLILMFISFISTYICFDYEIVKKEVIYTILSIFSIYFFIELYKSKLMKKELCLYMNIILWIVAVIITLFKKQTDDIIISDFLIFNVQNITLLVSVFTSAAFQIINNNHKLENKFAWYIFLIIPFIIISAFNNSVFSFVFLSTLSISTLLIWLEKKYSKEKIAGYVLLMVIFLLIITMITIIASSFLNKFFSSYFVGGTLHYNEVKNLRFTYLIYKSGLLFPSFFIVMITSLCVTLIFKAFLLKSNFDKAIVYSTSFSILFYLIFSIMYEIFAKNNNDFSTPFLSDSSFKMIIAMMIGLSISITGNKFNLSNKATILYGIHCICSIFRAKVLKSPVAFISYRRETGSDLAMHIHDRLQLKGINSFFDIESMKCGKFNEQIYQKIEECPNFILILTKDCLNRCNNYDDWVKCEISHAIKLNKNIVPIITKDFVFPNTLPNEIEPIRYYQGISANNEFFDYMIEKLIKMMK